MDVLTLVVAALFLIGIVLVQVGLSRVNDKLDVVHVLVNSKMTTALKEIETLRTEVARQKKQLEDK
jgi:hypothetical protein